MSTSGSSGGSNLRSARVVAAGLLLSKPTGYIRDALLAARFGTGPAMDAYTLAYTAATAAFDLVGTPLQKVLVPVLVRARERRGAPGLAATSESVLWAAAAVSLLIGALLLLCAGPLAGALTGKGAAAAPTAALIRWLSPFPLGLTLSVYASGWLQAGEHFALPAFVGLPFDFAVIGFVLGGHPHGVLAAVWGLIVGAFLQYALQWPGLRRFGHRVRLPAPGDALRDPGLRSTAAMALPLLISAGSIQAVNVLQQALASRLAAGDSAALLYAYRVLDVPSALFILPVITVLGPQLAARFASANPAAAAAVLTDAAWALAAGLLPSALLIALLASPLAAALFEHGAFGHASVQAMAAALAGFGAAVLTSGMQQLVRSAFYAAQDARTPMLWDVVAFVVTAVFDALAYRVWHQFGLALGFALGPAVAWIGLTVSFRRRYGRVPGGRRFLLSLAAGGGALAAVVLGLQGRVPAFLGHTPWHVGLAQILLRGAGGSVAYVAVVLTTGGGPMLGHLIGGVRARVRADPVRRGA